MSTIEKIEPEEIDLEEMFASRSGVYVLRARGDSMIDDHICDGDYVVIERRTKANDGDTVVALLDTGVCTLRRYHLEGGMVRLQPANPTHTPHIVEAERVKIQGVMIGVLRSYN